ncbi:hypothetical protein AB0M31_29760 [Streptomyces sp. NPDC051773]|uniref:hypothetical protein n=1 Tax=Streptomyces sp. NPDC051773 TaxID=3156682 RepID=UPI00342FCA52
MTTSQIVGQLAAARGFIEKRGRATDRFAAAALAVANGGWYADAHLAAYFPDDHDLHPPR